MLDPSRNPYVGARPFETEDRAFFFGRDEEARQLTSLVIAHRIVLFYAPSGAGKTSILKARVIPDIEERRRVHVLPVARAGGDLPRTPNGNGIANIFVFNILVSVAGKEARPAEQTRLGLADGLRPYLEGSPDEERARPRLLILDQFEELFTSHPDRVADRADFFLQLQQCLVKYPHLSLLISMREDYIANLDFYSAQLPDRLRTRFRMELLGQQGALAAVKEPAREAGCPFGQDVAQTLVDNLRRLQPGGSRGEEAAVAVALGDYVEPVHLQIVCRQLWANLPPEREMIQFEDVQSFGDVDQALRGFYEDALKKVFEKVAVGQRRVRLWFDRSLITPARTRGLVYRGDTETTGLPNEAAQVLYDEYVIRPITRGNDTWYELAHDRLVEPILEANRQWRAQRPDARQPLAAIPPAALAAGTTVTSHSAEETTFARPAAFPLGVRPNPYIGPRPFQTGEPLYGREREASALLDLLINERVVLLYSPSGAGKSSLINSAILPQLVQEGFRILGPARVGIEPASGGAPGLPGAGPANRYVYSLLLSLEDRKPDEERVSQDRLANMTLTDYVHHLPDRPTWCQGDAWVLDQLEEILTVDQFDLDIKAEFFGQMGEVLRNPGNWALFSMREEFIAGVDPYLRYIPGGLSTRFRLEPLGAEAAREYVTRSAAAYGVAFTEQAADSLINELRSVATRGMDGSTGLRLAPYLDPVQLQLVCMRLWDALPLDRDVIDERDVEGLGDLDHTLGNYYDSTVSNTSRSTGVSEGAIRGWIDRELISAAGTRTSVLRETESSQGLDNRAITAMVDAHLLRIEARGGNLWYELAHDRLLSPVRVSNQAWFEVNSSVLQRQAALWEQMGRPNSLLFLEEELARAEAWASTHADELGHSEREFLDSSRSAQAERERERQQSRRNRRLAVGAVALAILALAGVVAATVFASAANSQRAVAEAAGVRAIAERVIANAASTRAVMGEATANAASTQAVKGQESAQAANAAAVAALQTLEASLETNLTAQAQTVPPPTPASAITPGRTPSQTPTVSAQGTRPGVVVPCCTVAPSPSPNTTVIAQRTQLAQVRATQTQLANPPGPLLFASRRLGGTSRLFQLYAPGSGDPPVLLSNTKAFRPSVDVQARGNIVVFSTANRPQPGGQLVRILAAEQLTEIPIPGAGDSRWDPAISPDGSSVLFASASTGNQDIYLMNLDGSNVRNLTSSPGIDENAPAWSPDGMQVAFAAKPAGGQTDIWAMNKDGTGLKRLTDHQSVDTYPAWSPDGASIAFASNRDDPANLHPDIYILNLQTGQVTDLTNTPGVDENFPAWSRDGAWLAFTRFTTNGEIFIMPSAGGAAQNVTNNPTEDSYPAWW